jgi:hypothetical protein
MRIDKGTQASAHAPQAASIIGSTASLVDPLPILFLFLCFLVFFAPSATLR